MASWLPSTYFPDPNSWSLEGRAIPQTWKTLSFIASYQLHGHAVAWETFSCIFPCTTSKPLPVLRDELFSNAEHHEELKMISTQTKQIPNQLLKDPPPHSPTPRSFQQSQDSLTACMELHFVFRIFFFFLDEAE